MTGKKDIVEARTKLKQLSACLRVLQPEYLEGRLEIKTNAKTPEYFWRTNQNGRIQRSYIQKSQLDCAKTLAQISYNKKVARRLASLSEQLPLSIVEIDQAVDQVYLDLHPLRRELVVPVQKTGEQKFDAWKQQSYEGLPFREGDPTEIVTNLQERVRSKSEKILADFFLSQGIFYKYECPLQLSDTTVYYPDFTFFHPRRKQEIYWEHFGRMDLSTYAVNTVKKIRLYEENGIFLGKQLITTYKGDPLVLDMRRVQALIDRFELRFCAR